ncbi:MAG: leucine-rich repeat domain-containing protein [Promethearchaeota archaeon]|jgi:hypothetical protein
MVKREFTINKLLKMKLEGSKTYIYVAGEKFKQCRFLMLNIPVEEIDRFDEIKSIDEAAEIINPSMRHPPEPEKIRRHEIPTYKIHPEEEFWGLCSNLQAWYEHGYNTRLLHVNLAFPLLKRLADVGDIQAKRIFKEEIVERYNTGVESVRKYLKNMNYLDYLSMKELLSIVKDEGERKAVMLLIRKLFPTDNLDIDIKKGKVIKIKLQAQELGRVPELIQRLTSLEHLILSYNLLEELPEWIGEFVNLKILEVTDNCLKKLPDSIGSLKSLEMLKVCRNKIEYLPDSFGNLESIKILKLDSNQIDKLPESIGNLGKLELLDLQENNLITLPETIGELSDLNKLILRKNQLKNIPTSIIGLKNLKGLYLGNNNIINLPLNIGNLKKLESLSISDNPISNLPKSIYSSKKLRELYIGNTRLEKRGVIKEEFASKLLEIYFY